VIGLENIPDQTFNQDQDRQYQDVNQNRIKLVQDRSLKDYIPDWNPG